ncbi:LpqB family beta-propeller domain-containing protein [Agrococcus carbonis]|uniref:Sporulation and spore germination n=1 Tax=Agrococcus carbonis TaxID=684552 RepID=A0A1H1RQ97_9MICO|nr:LpqB family beta-propeller domain-containing protein [Agrococcus carbonis]SDS37931.1 Sporulation and spore germination [Agrococcus carbonis]
MKRMLLAAVAVLGLTGCITIPDAGPVQLGHVDTSEQSTNLVFLAQEPQPGATQEEIILGFLGAGVSPSGGFSIAREYLTDAAAARWMPEAQVLVRAVAPEVSLAGENEATAVVRALSEIGPNGALQLTDGDRMLEFSLAQVDGEWRITQAPDGIVLSSYHFDQLFSSHTLHWLTPDGTRSVPEVRWFERTAGTRAERVIDAVLAGPSTWLSPAVSTFGAVEASRVGEAQVDGTSMTVVLDFAQVRQLGTSSLGPLAAQLAASLRDLGVREVIVEVEGLDGVSASSADAPPIDLGAVDQRPLVLDGTALRAIGGAATVDDVGPTLAAIGATSFTVGEAGGVAHTGTTAAWIVPGVEPVVVSTDVAVVPTVDDSGWVLAQERGARQRLLAWRDGERAELTLPPGADRVTAMALSRDGARLALTTSQGASSEVWVLAVVRDADGRPTTLGEPYRMPQVDGAAVDITWAGPTQLAVLASEDDRPQIVMLDVGGTSEQLPSPDVPVRAIVGGSEGGATLRALAADGSVLSLRGQVWSPATGLGPVRLIATQQ